jgi:hypothetical protein
VEEITTLGAKASDSPRELAENSDVIVTIDEFLSNLDVEAVYDAYSARIRK